MKMFSTIRRRRAFKMLAAFLAVNILAEITFPTAAMALTSGPAQEEYASFEPVETTQMVDPYTGDFTYNLPLLSVPGPNGGYPINLAYHSSVGVDQEASWVGLGWNVNVGSINRSLRGLPDDFRGEKIAHDVNMKLNRTVTLDIPTSGSREVFGFPVSPNEVDQTSWGIQVYHNNYRGVGTRVSVMPKWLKIHSGLLKNSGIGLTYDSNSGLGINIGTSVTEAYSTSGEGVAGLGLQANINSRNGLESISFAGKFGGATGDGEAGGNSTISFPVNTFVPGVSLPTSNTLNAFEFKVSKDVTVPLYEVGFERWGSWSGSVHESEVVSSFDTPAYGYMYTENATDNGLKDFSRKNIAYSKKVPNLSPSNFTYDLFTITGQGTGGMFRPYVTRVYTLTDPKRENHTSIYHHGMEVGVDETAGDQLHIGFGFPSGEATQKSGSWEYGDDNVTAALSANYGGYPGWQNAYFQMYGEKTGKFLAENPLKDTTNYDGWGEDQAVRVKIDKTTQSWSREFIATSEFINNSTNTSAIYNATTGEHNSKAQRERRATNIETLTTTQAGLYGSSLGLQYKVDQNYLETVPSNPQIITVDKFPATNNDQLSEISIHQPDGLKYTYGLPAMNHTQKDASFRIWYGSGHTTPVTSQAGLSQHNVSLVKGWTENSNTSIKEEEGTTSFELDGYKSEITTPAYAHSWMLTSIVSNDYVDSDQEAGPSDGDLGYWVKFNYIKKIEKYKWRVPYTDANYIMGSEWDQQDDLASFSYGKKDIYYVESVETKTHIAIFTMSPRKDGYEAKGECNALETDPRGTRKLFKLDKIELFAKKDYETNPTTAVPVKTVHFKYDYSLCGDPTGTNVNPGNDGTTDMDGVTNLNADKGKLTLKRVWFTYNNSTRGELSPYKFTYSVTGNGNYQNPTYNFRNVDRWGSFTPNTEHYSLYPYINFPYTNQEINTTSGKHNADEYAQAWLLKKIELPSGGTMNIEYEADDYAYVQDEPAMQMLDILDLGDRSTSDWGTFDSRREEDSYSNAGQPEVASTTEHVFGDDGHFRVYFRLEKALSSSLTSQQMKDHIKNKYLRHISQVYFKINMDMFNTSNWVDNKFETVQGYGKIVTTGTGDLYGVVQDGTGGPYSIGYITLEREPLREPNLGNKFIHPFTKAGLAYLRVNREALMYDGSQFTGTIISLFSVIPDAVDMVAGFNWTRYHLNMCQKIALNGQSVIRLYAPDEKHGGGVRVKKLYVEESGFGTSGATSQYGQVFDYTIEENGETISSGVAYEPQVGGEESSLRQPVEYTESNFAKANQDLYVEQPLMEHYYPGAGVGYRKVTVKSLARENAGTNSMNLYTASPVTIYEFYSAKDFPVFFDQTDMSADPRIIRFDMIPGIRTNMRQSIARSQGYSVVLNDMAGKLKSITSMIPADPDVTGSQDKVLSHEKYFYSTVDEYDPNAKNRLQNYVDVVLAEGKCAKATLGETSDIFLDMNENSDVSRVAGINMNVGVKIIESPPSVIVLPIPIPMLNKMETTFKTVVTTKVIYRTGILKRVERFDGQANVVTENLAFDINTGEPLFTKVTNEFEDDIFSLEFPAYWYYTGMGNASKNHQLFLPATGTAGMNLTVLTDGKVDFLSTSYTAKNCFTEGDLLYINGTTKAHVIEVNNVGLNNYIRCITTTGAYLTGTVNTILVIGSGHRNLAMAKAGSVLTNVHPFNHFNCNIAPESGQTQIHIPGVIRSSAVTYSDAWTLDCGKTSPSACGVNPNDLMNPYKNGVKGIWRPHQSYAYFDDRVQNDNIREDGIYTDFILFNWKNPTSNPTAWKLVNTITRYSPYGFELENKDAVGIYSAATYGYGNSLVTAVGVNTKYNEMVYDGFEDYSLQNGCSDSHWSFPLTPTNGTISTEEAHTGSKSFKLTGTNTEMVTVSLSNSCSTNSSYYEATGVGIKLDPCGCNGLFRPEAGTAGKSYVVSFWTKEKVGSSSYAGISYANPKVSIVFRNGTTQVGSTANFTPQTDNKIIEGWQRVYGSVTVPTGADKMEVTFHNTGTDAGGIVYFDDVRLHPFDANIKSFVYDPTSLKQVAELDANNYATFFVYDQEGLLSKTKKETTEGIKTISEGRSGTKQ